MLNHTSGETICKYLLNVSQSVLRNAFNHVDHMQGIVCDKSVNHIPFNTSKHSSRMRTARLLAVSPSMHCAGKVCSRKGGSAPRGGALLPGGGLCSWGCLLPGGGVSECTEADTPTPCEQND